MKKLLLLALVSSACSAQVNSVWYPTDEHLGYAFGGRVDRLSTTAPPQTVFTIGALVGARNEAGVDQWVFGLVGEAIAMPGSKSIVVGLEAAAVNMEPTNMFPKIANNAVFKNRFDGAPDPGVAMNSNSIAYWVTAQPGTGFERGLVFDGGAVKEVAVDFSGVASDVAIMKFNDGCALFYRGHGVLQAVCP